MRSREVPLQLFEQVSAEFGVAKESKINFRGKNCTARQLEGGAIIGLAQNGAEASFIIWEEIPDSKNGAFWNGGIVEIFGGPRKIGSWSAYGGNRIKETVVSIFGAGAYRPLPLKHFCVPIVARAVALAGELAQNVLEKECWEEELGG